MRRHNPDKYPRGLITEILQGHSRCDRCDMNLAYSIFKDVVIFYRISPTRGGKILCVRCVLNSKHPSYHKTEQDLDDFISKIEVTA